jgi:hypothetical protein
MVIDRKKLSRLRVGPLKLGEICEMNVTALLQSPPLEVLTLLSQRRCGCYRGRAFLALR